MMSRMCRTVEKEELPPDPVIISIPLSGNDENPYFVNITTHHTSRMTTTMNGNVTAATTAEYDQHHLSTNGGPYDPGGITNSGPVIINGKLTRTKSNPIQSKYIGFGIAYEDEDEDEDESHEHEHEQEHEHESKNANFVNVSNISSLSSLSITTTVTKDTENNKSKNSKKKYWVMGTYGQLVSTLSSSSSNNSNTNTKKKIWNFVTGFDWLVYNGKSLVNDNNSNINNNNPTMAGRAYRAPRTVIGLDQDSNVILLVVDGCEYCLHRKGLTLKELANLLLDHGVIFAINMDGGRSSTMVMTTSSTKFNKPTQMLNNNSGNNNQNNNNFEVINRPTCLDIPLPYHCQRPVATFLAQS
ncbi:hypothetical protein FRACYDRAFT_256530 [Fragilariopsis cylindrus CCMP1102]|uniref:Phosphodiester glycosidase domain-containing protein n=1 Tax=Fragilariopsis cylindrus CCMP1102 TaxID=635003 RepID=A0A1E7EJN2_9STRA|nr:hypothetical protein FRACYDRAFT_256530 [Fragilariopsis cylindrus CCMP1102]|eukprot:OEU06104.1 hypothetical protein FRACYDRAFT_256530 [Fragilariopsis cylindrus CCMP1102]